MLDEIVSQVRNRVTKRMELIGYRELEQIVSKQRPARSMVQALSGKRISLIAEVKRRSPSAGILADGKNLVEIAQIYQSNGASAISVLTEEDNFAGSLQDLEAISSQSQIPVLRKDFILNEYMVLEARAYGADSVLLIVSILDDYLLKRLYKLSCDMGMEPLVEVYTDIDVARALELNPRIIGVNNRNLGNLALNLGHSLELASILPKDTILVAESGIKSKCDVLKALDAGYNAVLVGAALLRAHDIAAKVKELALLN
jgi:indole-3-glycerol phosphate synthase